LRGTAADTIATDKSGPGMPRADKTLDEMRANWRDWRIKASRRLAAAHGINVRKPGGSRIVSSVPLLPRRRQSRRGRLSSRLMSAALSCLSRRRERVMSDTEYRGPAAD
jgi:hypothetical protein